MPHIWKAQLSGSSRPASATAKKGKVNRYLKLPMASHGKWESGPGLDAMAASRSLLSSSAWSLLFKFVSEDLTSRMNAMT